MTLTLTNQVTDHQIHLEVVKVDTKRIVCLWGDKIQVAVARVGTKRGRIMDSALSQYAASEEDLDRVEGK